MDQLTKWLIAPAENEHLEFKEAKNSFSREKVFEYCCAIANEGGGYLVLGVTNSHPRKVISTGAYPNLESLNAIKLDILNKLSIRVEVNDITHVDGRVLIFQIPSRPDGTPLGVDGRFLMRAGESLVPMTADQMKKIHREGAIAWHEETAINNLRPEQVLNLLDTDKIFELLNLPATFNAAQICERLVSLKFIRSNGDGFDILNLGAILGAKKLSDFSDAIAGRKPRFILYTGSSKSETVKEFEMDSGLAVGFEEFVNYVSEASPQNRLLEEVIRKETKTFPLNCLRELVANAFVHQDFTVRGARVMVEMYEDRVEISNPGVPEIQVERFIDDWKSRNEVVADVLRRMGICEEKGSGVDKVISTVEVLQLPAPEFNVGASRTFAILFAPKKFSEMTKADRIRACYQHCVLKHVMRTQMSNSTRHARYVPFWALQGA